MFAESSDCTRWMYTLPTQLPKSYPKSSLLPLKASDDGSRHRQTKPLHHPQNSSLFVMRHQGNLPDHPRRWKGKQPKCAEQKQSEKYISLTSFTCRILAANKKKRKLRERFFDHIWHVQGPCFNHTLGTRLCVRLCPRGIFWSILGADWWRNKQNHSLHPLQEHLDKYIQIWQMGTNGIIKNKAGWTVGHGRNK